MKRLSTTEYITVMSNEHMSAHQRRFQSGLDGCLPVRFYKYGSGWISKMEYRKRKREGRIFLVVASLLCVILLLVACGCTARRDYGAKIIERPAVNIPMVMRESNYYSTGSCVHASLITLLRWQGKERLATEWRREFRGGEWVRTVAVKLDGRGVRYAYTTKGDVRFLEWACRTRRGCGITVNGGAHMITLVHLDSKWAAVLDNNSTSKFIWIPRSELIAEWKRSYGWAVTPVYSPLAPLPH